MKSLTSFLLLLISISVFAQNKPGTQVHIKRAHSEIKLDGILDEADWETADVAKNWFLNFPVDSQLHIKRKHG